VLARLVVASMAGRFPRPHLRPLLRHGALDIQIGSFKSELLVRAHRRSLPLAVFCASERRKEVVFINGHVWDLESFLYNIDLELLNLIMSISLHD